MFFPLVQFMMVKNDAGVCESLLTDLTTTMKSADCEIDKSEEDAL